MKQYITQEQLEAYIGYPNDIDFEKQGLINKLFSGSDSKRNFPVATDINIGKMIEVFERNRDFDIDRVNCAQEPRLWRVIYTVDYKNDGVRYGHSNKSTKLCDALWEGLIYWLDNEILKFSKDTNLSMTTF